jgi:hypothetical protein
VERPRPRRDRRHARSRHGLCHTAGESAEGEEVRAHIASIFATWPDIAFATRRLYVREGLVVQAWTASATHAKSMSRDDLVAEPTGRRVS